MLRKFFHPSWVEVLGEEYLITELKRINTFIKQERDSHDVYPEKGSTDFLRVFRETPFDAVSVVILAGEPYSRNLHNGLAIGVGTKLGTFPPEIPKELKGVVSELHRSYNKMPASNLFSLAWQGVLLLNTAQTVGGERYSHLDIWSGITVSTIRALQSRDNIVWILPGTHCNRYTSNITNETHTLIHTPHTSTTEFIGSGCFKECDKVMKKAKKPLINWCE